MKRGARDPKAKARFSLKRTRAAAAPPPTRSPSAEALPEAPEGKENVGLDFVVSAAAPPGYGVTAKAAPSTPVSSAPPLQHDGDPAAESSGAPSPVKGHRSPTGLIEACPVCGVVFDRSESEQGRASHINAHYGQTLDRPGDPLGDADAAAVVEPPAVCPVCNKVLVALNEQRRQQHVNRCLDEAALPPPPQQPERPEPGWGPSKCPICGVHPAGKSRKAELAHMKTCAKARGVEPAQLITLIKGQQPHVAVLDLPAVATSGGPEATGAAAAPGDDADEFRSAASPTLRQRKRRGGGKVGARNQRKLKLTKADAQDEGLQVALALSESLRPSSPPKRGRLSKEKRACRAQNETLVMCSKEERQLLVQAGVVRVLAANPTPASPCAATPQFRPSRMAGRSGVRRTTWDIHRGAAESTSDVYTLAPPQPGLQRGPAEVCDESGLHDDAARASQAEAGHAASQSPANTQATHTARAEACSILAKLQASSDGSGGGTGPHLAPELGEPPPGCSGISVATVAPRRGVTQQSGPELIGSARQLHSALEGLVGSRIGADVEFSPSVSGLTVPVQPIPAHRALLCARCDPNSDVIQLIQHASPGTPIQIDAAADIILSVLRFVYTGTCVLSSAKQYADIALVARSFGLPELEILVASADYEESEVPNNAQQSDREPRVSVSAVVDTVPTVATDVSAEESTDLANDSQEDANDDQDDIDGGNSVTGTPISPVNSQSSKQPAVFTTPNPETGNTGKGLAATESGVSHRQHVLEGGLPDTPESPAFHLSASTAARSSWRDCLVESDDPSSQDSARVKAGSNPKPSTQSGIDDDSDGVDLPVEPFRASTAVGTTNASPSRGVRNGLQSVPTHFSSSSDSESPGPALPPFNERIKERMRHRPGTNTVGRDVAFLDDASDNHMQEYPDDYSSAAGTAATGDRNVATDQTRQAESPSMIRAGYGSDSGDSLPDIRVSGQCDYARASDRAAQPLERYISSRPTNDSGAAAITVGELRESGETDPDPGTHDMASTALKDVATPELREKLAGYGIKNKGCLRI